jgi:acetylornithine aminotransferase
VEKLVSVCRKQGTLIVADEVQTGMGRTGSLFLYEQYGFEPDIMTLAKGLGSGFPIGAMLAKAEVAEAFQPGSHGSTFGGNFLASTAGYATLQEMTTTDLLNAVKENSEFLMNELKKLASDHSFIKDVRGRGFLIGLEVEAEAVNIVKAALEEHLLILVAGPNVVRLLPPVNVSKEEILKFLTIFTKLLQRFKEE